jgi:hypothetical protein
MIQAKSERKSSCSSRKFLPAALKNALRNFTASLFGFISLASVARG